MGRRIGTIPVRVPIERFVEGPDSSFEAEATQNGFIRAHSAITQKNNVMPLRKRVWQAECSKCRVGCCG